MPDFSKTQPGVVEGAVQSLIECRRMARRIEETIESLTPLLDPGSDHALEIAENIREGSAKLAHWLKTLYDRNAKDALGKSVG